MRVLCPPLDELLPLLLDVDRDRPLAVLDPGWPAALREAAHADLAAADLAPDDLVLFTSGSSGRPRGVVRTAASWRASLQPLTALTGLTADDVIWLPGPLSSSLSLYGAYHAASIGARVVTGRQLSPVDAATVTAAHLVPTLLRQLDLARLPRLATVVVAGESMPESLRRNGVVEYYGAAELSFVGARSTAGALQPFPGADVRVSDGEVWVRSAYLARGYLRAGDDGPLRRDGDWATVGDRGTLVDGGFTVTGRGGSGVTTGGHTVVVEEVEAVLSQIAGVRQVAVIGLPHERLGQLLVAVVVGEPGLRGQLVDAVQALPAPARPVRWLAAEQLPITTAGKLARAELAALAGTLPPLR